jgi:hypothetical protein
LIVTEEQEVHAGEEADGDLKLGAIQAQESFGLHVVRGGVRSLYCCKGTKTMQGRTSRKKRMTKKIEKITKIKRTKRRSARGIRLVLKDMSGVP